MICIAGPTASGKTDLAVALAAKPTPEERRGVPHHMLDVVEPDEGMSVGKFVDLAAPVVQDILARGKVAILAGGTGLYMDALVRGHDFAPTADRELRRELQAWARQAGGEALLEELRKVDPETAARLHPADEKRLIRALEVYRPRYFVHGHIHQNYGLNIPQRTIYGDTTILNAYSKCVFDY